MSYEETVKDIEKTLGMLPGFFKNTPKDVLPQMWPLFKKYQIGESLIPKKYREMMTLASACCYKMSILSNLSQRGCKNAWRHRARVRGISCGRS